MDVGWIPKESPSTLTKHDGADAASRQRQKSCVVAQTALSGPAHSHIDERAQRDVDVLEGDAANE